MWTNPAAAPWAVQVWGLALVSEIARQHNGQVKVTQSSEKGSTIALILPESTDY